MKTKRAYYTCPILAALATKYHGIKLIEEHTNANRSEEDEMLDWVEDTLDEMLGIVRYYVSEESMHLLEPQLDDGVEYTGLKGVWPTYGTVTSFSFPIDKTNLSVGLNSWCAPALKEDLIIFKRNNIPFPWPEFWEVE
jgi:hypothetical protein